MDSNGGSLREQHAINVINALADYVREGGRFKFISDGELSSLTVEFNLENADLYARLLADRMRALRLDSEGEGER